MDIWSSCMNTSPKMRRPEQYSPKNIPHPVPAIRLIMMFVDKLNLKFMRSLKR
jgi:hypothetical protein